MVEALALALLALAVAVVAGAQLQLYRIVRGGVPHIGDWAQQTWPLLNVGAGGYLDRRIIELIGEDFSGLTLICSDDHDEFGVVVSVMAVAAEWDVELLLLFRESGEPTGWEGRLPIELSERSLRLSPAGFASLGGQGTPVLLAVTGGRVVDATHRLSSPSQIAEWLRYVAGQIGKEAVVHTGLVGNRAGSGR